MTSILPRRTAGISLSRAVALGQRQSRALSSTSTRASSWPAGARDEEDEEHHHHHDAAPQSQSQSSTPTAPDRASLKHASPDDPQVPPNGGGHPHAPTMRGISLQKSAAGAAAFVPVDTLRASAGAQLRDEHESRVSSDATATATAQNASRSRAGPSLESRPPPSRAELEASDRALASRDPHAPLATLSTSAAAARSNASAPTGPGMSPISAARAAALPPLAGAEAHSVRRQAVERAEKALGALHRGAPATAAAANGGEKPAKAAAREGVQHALRRMASPAPGPGAGEREAELRELSERAAKLGLILSEKGGRGEQQLPPPPRQKTIMYLENMKRQGTPIVALTAFDFPSALALRSADVDICLVGDSLANVALGYTTTQHVTLSEMLSACQAVQRGISSPILAASSSGRSGAAPLVVCDLPFGTFQASVERGVDAAVSLVQRGKVEAVKIEGGAEVRPLIERLVSFGIPVMGHIGLQPQKVGATSGYRVQGRTAREAREIYEQALMLQEAGVFAMVLECVPARLAAFISERLRVPTIGIGAGSGTDGQVLVMSDMVGELTSPAHVLAGLAPPASAGRDAAAASGGERDAGTQAAAGQGQGEREGAGGREEEDAIPRPHPSAPAPPKFVRLFTPGGTTIGALRQAAVQAYVAAVRSRDFPAGDSSAAGTGKEEAGAEAASLPLRSESYKMKREEWRAFVEGVEGDGN